MRLYTHTDGKQYEVLEEGEVMCIGCCFKTEIGCAVVIKLPHGCGGMIFRPLIEE